MSNVPSTSTDDYWLPDATSPSPPRSRVVLRFFVVGTTAVLAAGLIAWSLSKLLGRPANDGFRFPVAFAASTLFLLWGSISVERALRAVKRERQRDFRRHLRWSVAIGSLFMGVQSYAVWTIIPAEKSAAMATMGVAPFVLMLAALHGLHFLVATLFVSYVAVQAHAGRYDHEYYWGVTVCAWFWHVLGIVWGAILAVYSIAAW